MTRLVVPVVLFALGLTGPAIVQSTAAGDNQSAPDLERGVTAAYAAKFGESIPKPAILNVDEVVDCKGRGHLTTTAYLKMTSRTSKVMYMYMPRDGSTVLTSAETSSALTPAGVFRVLVVITRYPDTFGETGLERWEAAQREINDAHINFAREQGYAAPIVRFENTNIVLDPDAGTNPRESSSIRAAAERAGVSADAYEFTVSVNLDPSKLEGGFAGNRFVYMGNYSKSWQRPLAPAEWKNVASAVYYHEVAHLWGWPGTHDWAICGGNFPPWRPFIVPPVLFGWTDVDGDGVPEILDDTPYGRLVGAIGK